MSESVRAATDGRNAGRRVVVVTGASRGIGLVIARRFIELGDRVVLHGRSAPDEAVLCEAVQRGDARVVSGDLSRDIDRSALFAAAIEAFGTLDVLVNNASVQTFGTLREWSEEASRNLLQVNLVAAIDCMRRAAQVMEGGAGDRCIVNVASVRASRPGAGGAMYAATKAALVCATRSAAVEYGPAGIRVNAVSPGLIWREGIETEWGDGVRAYQAMAPLRRIGRPDDVADACTMLASPAAGWITGVDLIVDGGISLVR